MNIWFSQLPNYLPFLNKISTVQVMNRSMRDLLVCMILQTINPTVSNSITELFLLPVQYMLQKGTIHSYTSRKCSQDETVSGKVNTRNNIPLADMVSHHHQMHYVRSISQSFQYQVESITI